MVARVADLSRMRVTPPSFIQDSRRSSEEDDLDLGLKDRVAIVAGGGRGIGKACDKEMLAEGSFVVLVSNNPDINAAAVRDLGKLHPGRVLGVPTDLADDAAIPAMTTQVVDRHGPLAIVVNSA